MHKLPLRKLIACAVVLFSALCLMEAGKRASAQPPISICQRPAECGNYNCKGVTYQGCTYTAGGTTKGCTPRDITANIDCHMPAGVQTFTCTGTTAQGFKCQNDFLTCTGPCP